MFEEKNAAKLVWYQHFHELVDFTYTSYQCSEVLENHGSLLAFPMGSVQKKVLLSVTDGIFGRMKNNICSEKHLDLKRTFINIIKCIINKRKPNSNSNMFFITQICWPKKKYKVFVQNLSKSEKKINSTIVTETEKVKKTRSFQNQIFQYVTF